MPWNRGFDDPVPPPKGEQFATLKDAATYITNLPNRIRPSRPDSVTLRPMPFSVRACFADHPLTVTIETAKEAFAKAIEWHVVERFIDVSICDGIKSYSIDSFASAMALRRLLIRSRPPPSWG